jgi:hypothetical protein
VPLEKGPSISGNFNGFFIGESPDFIGLGESPDFIFRSLLGCFLVSWGVSLLGKAAIV